MNYDLALMALEGLARSPLTISREGNSVEISGSGASFKELARLCLLLGGENVTEGEAFELQPGMHVGTTSVTLKLVKK